MSERLPLAEIVAMRAVMWNTDYLHQRCTFGFDVGWKTIILFVIRGMCLVAAMYLYFLALSTLPISTVVSIFFTPPLLITLSAVFLNEKLGASYSGTSRANRRCSDHAPRHKFLSLKCQWHSGLQ